MKKLQFLNLLFAALFLVTFASCDNDGDDDATPNNTSLLTAAVWNGDKLYYQGQDATEIFEDIIDVKATSIRFFTDGTYTIDVDGTADDEMLVDINKLTATELWAEGDFGDTGEKLEIRFVK